MQIPKCCFQILFCYLALSVASCCNNAELTYNSWAISLYVKVGGGPCTFGLIFMAHGLCVHGRAYVYVSCLLFLESVVYLDSH